MRQTEYAANRKLPVPASQRFRARLLLNKLEMTNLVQVQMEQSTDTGAKAPHKLLY